MTETDQQHILLDAPSDSIWQGSEVEIDTTNMPVDEDMGPDYDPGSAYAVDPDVSSVGIATAS